MKSSQVLIFSILLLTCLPADVPNSYTRVKSIKTRKDYEPSQSVAFRFNGVKQNTFRGLKCDGQEVFGGFVDQRQLSATIATPQPHHSVIIAFTLWFVDSWDGERVTCSVGSTDQGFQTAFSVTVVNPGFVSQNFCGLGHFGDRPRYYQLEPQRHSADQLEIKLDNTLDQRAQDESLGIANIEIYLALCNPGCASCNDSSTCTSCPPTFDLDQGECRCRPHSSLANGRCPCLDTFIERDGACRCLETFIVKDGACSCPENATLIDGRCVCRLNFVRDKDLCVLTCPDAVTRYRGIHWIKSLDPETNLENSDHSRFLSFTIPLLTDECFSDLVSFLFKRANGVEASATVTNEGQKQKFMIELTDSDLRNRSFCSVKQEDDSTTYSCSHYMEGHFKDHMVISLQYVVILIVRNETVLEISVKHEEDEIGKEVDELLPTSFLVSGFSITPRASNEFVIGEYAFIAISLPDALVGDLDAELVSVITKVDTIDLLEELAVTSLSETRFLEDSHFIVKFPLLYVTESLKIIIKVNWIPREINGRRLSEEEDESETASYTYSLVVKPEETEKSESWMVLMIVGIGVAVIAATVFIIYRLMKRRPNKLQKKPGTKQVPNTENEETTRV